MSEILSVIQTFRKATIALSVLFISVSGIICLSPHSVYAEVQGTYVTKVTVDKHTIKRGETQTIEAKVSSKSGAPLTTTTVTFTINYADSETTRQASVAADASGHAAYSWQLGSHVKPGNFEVTVEVSGPGFVSQSFPVQSFIVL